MPLDGRNWSRTETETKPDLSKPSLEGLSWLLRREMPKNHTWNFAISFELTECGTAGCALGVARCIWGTPIFRNNDPWRIFGIPHDEYKKIFHAGASSWYGVPDNCVTPTMVADRIDAYLAQRHGGE